jgi:uncharacterized membrane protein YdfJ with MMPL/SSD domain
MLEWVSWVLAMLAGPMSAPTPFALGLAVVAAALLVVAAAAGLPVLPAAGVPAGGRAERRHRPASVPRLRDPDAAGRPRPRAPTPNPAA